MTQRSISATAVSPIERCSPAPSPLPKALRATRIGHYRPYTTLGSGGMATVYLASGAGKLGTRRCCALKVLHQKLSNSETYLSMFLNEARIASEISHPHVCSVFDYGCVKGQAYLAMDFLAGKSLASLSQACGEIADPELHARRIARILADACEGLSAIHEYRSPSEGHLHVVHRDISPDNLVLGFDGFVKIIDFGLAKIECRGERTQSGILKGKISYIAPELLRGDAASASADIWSLGVVAWELLTGQRLFRKLSDAETVRAISEQEVLAPSQVLNGLPTRLDAIVLRALQRDPSLRYPTAADFSRDLWEFMRSQSTIVQHRELGDWLEQLFPGEREQTLRRLESVAASIPEEERPRRVQRNLRLLQGLRGRVSRALPARRSTRALGAVLVATAVIGVGVLRWTREAPRAVWPNTTSAGHFSRAGLDGESSALHLEPQARWVSPAGFAVEIERGARDSDLIVHVRATGIDERVSVAR